MLLPDSPVKSRTSPDLCSATGKRLKSLKQVVGSRATLSRTAFGVSVGIACLLMGGCMGSPTYGTDTPADKQLLDDVTGMITLQPKETRHVDTTPRPDLVRPSKSEVAVLPPPQQDVTVASNSQWPESPEAKRKRLKDEATANQADPNYDPQIAGPGSSSSSEPALLRTRGTGVSLTGGGPDSGINQSAEFKRRMAANQQGSPTERRYLSDPPLSYRQPAGTAATGELGQDEWRKDRDRKKAALGKKAGFQLSDLWPFK
jgi:hypothetical protein